LSTPKIFINVVDASTKVPNKELTNFGAQIFQIILLYHSLTSNTHIQTANLELLSVCCRKRKMNLTTITEIPVDWLKVILASLPASALLRLGMTCRKMRQVIQSLYGKLELKEACYEEKFKQKYCIGTYKIYCCYRYLIIYVFLFNRMFLKLWTTKLKGFTLASYRTLRKR
jgi:hypothetical protein